MALKPAIMQVLEVVMSLPYIIAPYTEDDGNKMPKMPRKEIIVPATVMLIKPGLTVKTLPTTANMV